MNEMRDYDNRYYDDNIRGYIGYRENYKNDMDYRDYDYRRDYDRKDGRINNRYYNYRNYRNYREQDFYEDLEMTMHEMKEISRKLEDVADMAENQQDKNMLMKIAQKEKENSQYIKQIVEK